GIDGAKPGIIMQAHPAVGNLYRQEFALSVGEDVASVMSLDSSASVPAGTYAHCLQTNDFAGLEPGVIEQKFYAPGVGSVLEIDNSTGERRQLLQITTE